MKQRLQHSRLEQAITGKKTLAELLDCPCQVLSDYCLADYVGNPALKQDRTVDNSHARGFFVDQGAWRETKILNAEQRVSLAIFATFLVVEIDAGKEIAEFLVLMPKREPQQEGGMYVGLMKSHNTDALRQQLADDVAVADQLGSEIDTLLAWLRQPKKNQATASENWLGRLFSKRHKNS